MVNVEIEETFNFCFGDKIQPDYRKCHSTTIWLQENLQELTDDNGNIIFSKVNLGYGEDKLKSFTKKPTCDVHINNVNFDNSFDESQPETINSIIVFKMKGNNNRVAETATTILDFLIQEFITNESFRRLDGVVSDTHITNAGLRQQPGNSNWYILGVLELQHNLF